MVDALRSLAAPPKGPTVDVFLALMVDALESLSAPPMGPAIDIF
jgi:hypothetical protein